MRIGRNEIIEELTEHIRQCGGEMDEWCVGTASRIQDGTFRIGEASAVRSPKSEVESTEIFKAQDGRLQNAGEPEIGMSKLAYREAHTPYAAADAVDYLVSAFGLRPAPGSAPGKIVFVYRRAPGADVAASSPLHAAA